MSQMVCSPHQYTLIKMAMPVYQPTSQYAARAYALNLSSPLYQRAPNFQSRYISGALPQMDYNLSAQSQEEPLFQPTAQFVHSVSPNTKKETSTMEINPHLTRTAVSSISAPGLYSLPINYNAQPQEQRSETSRNGLIDNLAQLIQRELLNLQLQVQHV